MSHVETIEEDDLDIETKAKGSEKGQEKDHLANEAIFSGFGSVRIEEFLFSSFVTLGRKSANASKFLVFNLEHQDKEFK